MKSGNVLKGLAGARNMAWLLHLGRVTVGSRRGSMTHTTSRQRQVPVHTPMLAAQLALYVGPDQLLPLTSILGAIGGALMIFWRQVTGFFKKIFKRTAN